MPFFTGFGIISSMFNNVIPNPSEEKSRLRQKALKHRSTMNIALLSQKIRGIIEEWSIFKDSESVLTYSALPDEIDLLPLTDKYPDKRWYLPRTMIDGTLKFHRFLAGDTLEQGKFKIYEPSEGALPLDSDLEVGLIFVPCLMLDKDGIRLGFGGGYYDRFLSGLNPTGLKHNPPTACPVASSLLVEKLPRESWDIPVKWGITELGVTKFN